MDTPEPHNRTEIVDALLSLADEGLDFWKHVPPERFAARFGEAWSPAENVRHLIKSTKPVAQALSMPRSELAAMFGTSAATSDSFAGVRERYQARLVGGADAGKFAPEAMSPPADPEAWQLELIGTCRDAVRALADAAGQWEEDDLDQYQIPHPLLGNLTVREMLFFTLYHHGHHRQNVAGRMAALGPVMEA